MILFNFRLYYTTKTLPVSLKKIASILFSFLYLSFINKKNVKKVVTKLPLFIFIGK